MHKVYGVSFFVLYYANEKSGDVIDVISIVQLSSKN